jgi:hypothetical protein
MAHPSGLGGALARLAFAAKLGYQVRRAGWSWRRRP